MEAGKLTECIAIHRRVDIRTEYGAMQSRYEPKCAPYCAVEWLNGSKSMKNGELVTTERIAFTIRDHYSIAETDRILYDGKKYNIISICKRRNIGAIELIGEVVNE